MKLFNVTRKMTFVAVLVVLLALSAGVVLAGGWAVITLDELPGQIYAGENVHLSFMVRQHGETPVHFLDNPNSPIEPLFTAHNPETGERLTMTAVRGKEVGRFTLDVVFPSEGNRTRSIVPNPLAGTTEFAPLTILPAVKVPAASLETTTTSTAVEAAALTTATATATNTAGLLRGAAVLLLAAGAGVSFLAVRRRQPQPAVVDAGD
jgi:hypothetical protein